MNPFAAYSRSDWLKLVGLALLYAATAQLSLSFATVLGTLSLIWIPSGLALAAMLIGGKKYGWAILVGSWGIFYFTLGAHSVGWSLLMGVGNLLEAWFGFWILSRYHRFDLDMSRARDFFLLLEAALLGPAPSALIGGPILIYLSPLPSESVQLSVLYWWMGETFSILLMTPLILIWRRRPHYRLRGAAAVEPALLLGLTLLFGQMIFFEWTPGVHGPLASASLMFVFVLWSAMRFGRHMTLVVLCLTLAQAILSAVAGTGFFAHDLERTGLASLWIYMATLVAAGMALASAADERNASQKALESSNARFIAFMDNLPGMAYIKDARRRYIFVNKAFEIKGVLKLPASAYLGKTMEELDPYRVTDKAMTQVRADDEAVLQRRQPTSQELLIGPVSDQNTLLALKFPIIESSGDVLLGGITLDISDRKRAEARIARLTQLYKALSEVNQGIVRLTDAAELFPLVCRTAVNYGGVRMAWIGQVDPVTERIVAVASYGSELDFLDGLVISSRADDPEGRAKVSFVFRDNRSIVINDIHQDERVQQHRKRLAHHGFNACASFPVQRSGRPFAVFTVYHEQIDAFDAEAVRLLEEMSNDISFALDNLDREQHFRAFFERSMVGMATTSVDKHWLDVNAALCRMLGYEHDELLQLTWADVTHPDDLGSSITYFDQVIRGEIDDCEQDLRYIRKDGKVVYTHNISRCLRREDGSVDYFVVLIQDISEKKQSEERLWRQANFDTLTGLPNRRMFADRLEQEIKKRHHTKLPLALLFIDLDRFKEVNDTLGHIKGDTLLVEAARRIQECVRESDTVARLGGDEFMIILAELPDVHQVETIAHGLLRRLTEAFHLGAETVYVSASIGITLYPADAGGVEQLLRNADQAMYAAKNLGRNRFSYFTNALQEAAQTRQKLTNDLRGALAERKFELYFQPIVDLAGNRIVKAEALLRWHHPQRGMINPVEFVPLAEETGLILEIGDWVFREAARWTQRWAERYAPGIQVSINTSPVEFQADSYDPEALLKYMRLLGLPGNSIAIEITEGVLLNTGQRVFDHLRQFRRAGLHIAIDDFGTGYSSLASLKKFDIDYLKIDQAFVRNLVSDPNDMALSEAIIVMAHKLGLQVVAEGIETPQQRALLQAAGCDYGQGYLFSKAVPPQEFEALLAAQAALPDL